jgi:hypothetical protein
LRGITGLGFVGPIAWICSTKRRGNEAVPLPPTLALSNHQLSGGWQNEGFTSSGTFSELNQAAHKIQQKQDLTQRLIKAGYSSSKVVVMTEAQIEIFYLKSFS